MIRLLSAVAVLAILGVLPGCNKSEELEKQNAELQNQNASLVKDLTERDTYIDTVTQVINEVYTSLEHAGAKEKVLQQQSSDVEASKKRTPRELRGKLLDEIGQIDSSLHINQRRLSDLEKRTSSYRSQFAGLNRMIANLKKTIEEREKSIADLDQKVKGLETEVAEKTRTVAQRDSVITTQNATIAQQHNEITTAFYIVGKRDDLEKRGIIVKQGGFLWGLLGSTTILANGFDPSDFQPINRTIDTTITVNGGIDEIVPKRVERYYSQTKTADKQTSLEITDPKNFWQDKYLVIITD